MKKILLYVDSYGERVGVNEAYVHFLSMFGEVMLVTPSNDLPFYIQHADILALPGGADVDPARYGEKPQGSGRVNPHYEYLDKHLLMPWLETAKPIIAICRGMQTLNVAMGGSLYQDIFGHVGNGEKRWETKHPLYTNLPGYKYYLTNSFHHQSIKKLADGFEIIGWSPVMERCPSLHDKTKPRVFNHYQLITEKGKGTRIEVEKDHDGQPANYYSHIEIIRHKERPYIAFQYHPEEFFCPLAIELIEQVVGIEANDSVPII